MSWSNRYIAFPYEDMGRSETGCDCWGLARLVYARELGIALPSYSGDYVSAEEFAETDALISSKLEAKTWHLQAQPAPFDLLLFRAGRFDSHIGMFVERGLMLHVHANDQSKIETFERGRWKLRFKGAYRHIERTFNGGSNAA